LVAGLSGTYTVNLSNSGDVSAPVELYVSFGGRLQAASVNDARSAISGNEPSNTGDGLHKKPPGQPLPVDEHATVDKQSPT
jgi:hypothetical protein